MTLKSSFLMIYMMVSICSCKPSDDNSVVSVYTTQPSNTDNRTEHSSDIYTQIANNIAEKITTPVIKFLGLDSANTNSTEAKENVSMKKTTKFEYGYPEKLNEKLNDINSTSNAIEDIEVSNRDIEELSPEYNITHQRQNKPEKITIYTTKESKKDFNRRTHTNSLDTQNMKDEDDSDDSDEVILEPITKATTKTVKKRINAKQSAKEHSTVKPKKEEQYNKSFFVYLIELVGSFFQLVTGAFETILKPRF